MGSIVLFSCPAAIASAADPDVLAGSSDDARGAAVMFALMGLCSLIYAITRATAVRRTFVSSRQKTDAEPELLRLVARRQRKRAIAFAAGCVVAGLAIMRLPIELETRLVLELTPAMMLMVALVGIWRLQPLVKIGEGVRVMSHGDFFYAARDGRLVGWVAAPPKLVARASRLPIARLA